MSAEQWVASRVETKVALMAARKGPQKVVHELWERPLHVTLEVAKSRSELKMQPIET